MANVGRTIFYDVRTGDVIKDTGEHSGGAVYREPDFHIQTFTELSERNRDTFDFVELEYGEYAQDFTESRNNYRVNPETKTLEFSNPDPNAPEEPQPYQKPLSDQIKDLETKYDAAVMELTMLVAGGM